MPETISAVLNDGHHSMIPEETQWRPWRKKPQNLTLLPSLLAGLRVFHGTNLLLEVKRWIERVHPQIWARHGGRDHIWLLNHDEGACWAPSEIWQGIMLTHWGRTDPDHVSMTVRHPKP